jgi:hypothetical protein
MANSRPRGWSSYSSHALQAQQKSMLVTGFHGSTSPGPFAPLLAALHQGLSEAGIWRGKTLAIESPLGGGSL